MTSVVGGPGLIETMRSREGDLPWLQRHLARLRASCAALGVRVPAQDLEALIRNAGSGDRAIRLEVRDGHAEVTTREVGATRPLVVVVSAQIHLPYPHKTTDRMPFGRALAAAKRTGADDAVLVTATGAVAEGTAWSLFWWDERGDLCTPSADLGILPGIARGRIMELAPVQQMRVAVPALLGRSLFLVNAVRGVVEIGTFQGQPVPRDSRTAELSSSFWPD